MIYYLINAGLQPAKSLSVVGPKNPKLVLWPSLGPVAQFLGLQPSFGASGPGWEGRGVWGAHRHLNTQTFHKYLLV